MAPLDVSYSLASHAERIEKFSQAIGLKSFHLVGHDLGGGISQIVAVKHPKIVRDMVLINPVGYDYWPVQPITSLRTPIIRQLLMATLDLEMLELVVKRGLRHPDRLTTELMALFKEPLSTPDGRRAFLHFARCLDNQDLTSIAGELRQLKLPVLIVRGDADPYLSEEIALKLNKEIPQSRLVRVSEASHFAQEDVPDWLSQQILLFWKSCNAR